MFVLTEEVHSFVESISDHQGSQDLTSLSRYQLSVL